MPELPEVEGFKQYFNRTSNNKKIVAVTCKTPSLLKNVTPAQAQKILSGHSFETASRRGKFLISPIKNSPYTIVFHFGMTGSLDVAPKNRLSDEDKKYGQLIFIFSDGTALVWINKRKFGRVYLVTDTDEIKTLKTMGPDALAISQKDFLELLNNKKTSVIKTLLMDQSKIAGIGNEYSNEILYQAGVLPQRKIASLSTPERKRIFSCIQKILKKAIALRTSSTNLPNSWLLAHIKVLRDMKCPKNKDHTLVRKTIGGRSAIYCPIDQK